MKKILWFNKFHALKLTDPTIVKQLNETKYCLIQITVKQFYFKPDRMTGTLDIHTDWIEFSILNREVRIMLWK